LGVLSYYEDIDEDVEDSMEKTSRNVEVAPDKFAILRSPERTSASHLVYFGHPEGLLLITLLINNKYLP
jgi:hypothetical protein